MAHVDVVIDKTKEATEMVGTMNKNVAAYLSNYLAETGLPLALIKHLLEVSVDPTSWTLETTNGTQTPKL